MDNGSTEDNADARGDLANWLDDYTAGRCDRAQMQASFLDICRRNPEAPWDALALLDQYQRRGHVDPSVARVLKSDIAQLVFGVVNQTEDDESAVEPSAPTTDPTTPSPESTGTRWRRMAAEQEATTKHSPPEPTFIDPAEIVREAPRTRPGLKERVRTKEPAASTSSVLRNRYELLTVLGRGTTGTVYKAFDRHRAHLDPASQCVAVRVLTRNQPQGDLVRQFAHAQSLSHPNIVSVFDLDRDGETHFVVMELLDGELLSDKLRRLDRQPMPRPQALAIIDSIGSALVYAHRRGVVHSGLSPDTVMVTASGELKLLEFGLPRRTVPSERRNEPWIDDPAGGLQPAVNLAYASEERVNGDPAHRADDVYSFACIAYELLSGQHPFGGRSAPLAREHGRPPQRIAKLSGHSWNALQIALRWQRSARNIDAAGLAAALSGATRPAAPVAPQPTVSEPRRTGIGVAIAALAVLVLAAAAGIYWLENRTASPVVASVPPIESSSEPVAEPAPLPAAQPVEQPPPQVTTAPVATALPQASTTPAAAGKQEAAASSVPRRVAFESAEYVATESDGSVKLTISRSGVSAKPLSFSWRLLPQSADAGEDFAAIGPRTETIPAGSKSTTVLIPLVSDAVKERTEMFAVELGDPGSGAELGEPARTTVIIVDDD